jgi:hypothetical protein
VLDGVFEVSLSERPFGTGQIRALHW